MTEPIKISDEDDAWDDELLIQEYNRTVRLVDQRIAELESGDLSAKLNAVDLGKTNEIKKDKRKSKSKDDSKELLWKTGDHCVAVFKEDGQEYEATIESIDHKYGCCVVKYLGYNNVELQYLQDLKPTRGLQAQLDQMQIGFTPGELEDGELHNIDSSPEFVPENPQHLNCGAATETTPEFILPPPPTFLTTNLAEPLSKENDALASMLMAWYMCGFQTGYYTALKQMKVKE